MKKLLFVWSGLRIGGSERALLPLVKYLIKDYAVEILCHQHICEYTVLPDVKIKYIKTPRIKIFNKLSDKVYLWQAIYKHASNVDVVICNEFPLLAIFSYFVAKLQRKPLIIWNHSCRDELALTNNSMVELVYKYVLKSARSIVNVSSYSERSLFKYVACELENSQVIYNSVDVVLPSLPRIVHHQKAKYSIVAIGGLIREKNFSLLICAAEVLIKEHHLDIEVIICGDGIEKNNLLELISTLDLNAHVKLVGKVSNPLDYIQASDLLVSPSNSESFSLVVCEALLLNKPVIVTDTGAAEVVGNGKYGIVIERNNKEQLVNALLTVIKKPLFVQSMLENYDVALSRFNADTQVIPRWKKLFTEL